MKEMRDLFQSADWKAEKHVPVIDAPEKVKKDTPFRVTVTVGKQIPHPNTTEHFIAWLEVFFQPEGAKFPSLIGRFDLGAHGAAAEGPNTSTVYTIPEVTCVMKTGKPGTLNAVAYCNIHGLWASAAAVAVE